MQKVVIEEFSGVFSLYNEGGQCVEDGFESYEEAEQYTKDNDLELVKSFFV